MWPIILIALGSSLAINLVLFLLAYHLQSDKLTDISYALSFLTIDIVSLWYAGNFSAFNWLIFAMPALWSVRIGGFLLMRVLRVGKDRRFDGMRESFVRFGKFWLGQAITAWVLMLPVTIALYRSHTVTLFFIIGSAVWLAGLLLEAIADAQKFAFKQDRNNDGKWIQQGVWKYARHPNYLGEILVWCGVYIACFSTLNTLERIIGLASPTLITVVLLYVSGVPLLEKSADNKWGNMKAYQAYKQRTRLLIPLPK